MVGSRLTSSTSALGWNDPFPFGGPAGVWAPTTLVDKMNRQIIVEMLIFFTIFSLLAP
jgi:hypothetical protein